MVAHFSSNGKVTCYLQCFLLQYWYSQYYFINCTIGAQQWNLELGQLLYQLSIKRWLL